MVIREFTDSPESGTEANPIVIRHDSAPLDSASNHIVIHVNEDCAYDETEQPGSVADAETMPSPELWENLIDGGFLVPADEGATVDLTSILALARLQPVRTQKSQILGQLSTSRLHLDHKALKVTKNTFHVEGCPVYADLSVI